ncbi:MAG TPA: GDCCVxC domain-containing (seleno)protein [Steroidobacteraceae bacterium]|nr:GDCCVxC domain-containing (seleno)protein [Steroidobacteraceae bacterium]
MPPRSWRFASSCIHELRSSKGCATVLRPKHGDCCVFGSYGSVKYPPIQMNSGCCGTSGATAAGNDPSRVE